MKVYAIVNPVAGGGYSEEIYRSVLKEFEGLDLEYSLTEKPGHATGLARKAMERGFTHIVCVGGDGTLNEIVQSMAHSDAVLVPISAGTGSDFVKTIGLRDIPSVVKAVQQERSVPVDLGRVTRNGESRYFLNILEVGFGARVMKRVNSRKKVHDGSSFTSAVLSSVPSYRPYEVKVTHEGGTESLRVAEMIIANGKYFGGGMLAAPNADPRDGMLDVHMVRGTGRIQLLMKMRKLRDGSHIHDDVVTSLRTASMAIEGDAPVEMDGENYGNLPIEVSLEKDALRIVDLPGKNN